MFLVIERLNPGPGQKQPSAKQLPSADHTGVRSSHKPGPRRTASERWAFYSSVWLVRSDFLSSLPPPASPGPSFKPRWQYDNKLKIYRHTKVAVVAITRWSWLCFPFVPFMKSFSSSSSLLFLPRSLLQYVKFTEFLFSVLVRLLSLSRLLGREHYNRKYLSKADTIIIVCVLFCA